MAKIVGIYGFVLIPYGEEREDAILFQGFEENSPEKFEDVALMLSRKHGCPVRVVLFSSRAEVGITEKTEDGRFAFVRKEDGREARPSA